MERINHKDRLDRARRPHIGPPRWLKADVANFSALVVVGDGQGHVGVGLGKAGEVRRPSGRAEMPKEMFAVPGVNTTIPSGCGKIRGR